MSWARHGSLLAGRLMPGGACGAAGNTTPFVPSRQQPSPTGLLVTAIGDPGPSAPHRDREPLPRQQARCHPAPSAQGLLLVIGMADVQGLVVLCDQCPGSGLMRGPRRLDLLPPRWSCPWRSRGQRSVLRRGITMVNLASNLVGTAGIHAGRVAVRVGETAMTYRELDLASARVAWQAQHVLTIRWVQLACDHGALTALPVALNFQGTFEVSAGRLDAARACFAERVEISAATGNPGVLGTARPRPPGARRMAAPAAPPRRARATAYRARDVHLDERRSLRRTGHRMTGPQNVQLRAICQRPPIWVSPADPAVAVSRRIGVIDGPVGGGSWPRLGERGCTG
jgi:hypothetical protein